MHSRNECQNDEELNILKEGLKKQKFENRTFKSVSVCLDNNQF